MNETLDLVIGQRVFSGWTGLRVTRELERMASDFDIEAAGIWPGDDAPVMPFDPVVIRLGGVIVLTGYVDEVAPSLDATTHAIRIAGRSKTADLIDCTPELRGSELRGATLEAVARALAAPFGIEVVSRVDAGDPLLSEAMLDKGETAFDAIERLCRLRGVLATDGPAGELIITRAGDTRAVDTIEEGRNILSGKVSLRGDKRFSRYIVQAQRQTAAAASASGDGDDADADPAERPNAGVAVSVLGLAEDPEVPRYRPRIIKAEAAMNAAQARERAVWAATTARAASLRGQIVVQGWLQSDGQPWLLNQLVGVQAPTLLMSGEFLIAGVSYGLDVRTGRTTELTLGPPEAWTPEPPKVSRTARGRGGAGRGGSGDRWAGVGSAIR